MKIPPIIHHHNRVDHVLNQLSNRNVDEEFKNILNFWKKINDN